MNCERIGDVLVCRVGKGEWYNQPHNRRWDMDEDVADIPPAQWHLDVQRVIEAQDSTPKLVVVDASEMDQLVGQDWGFLLEFNKRVVSRGSKLSLIASERMVKIARILRLEDYFNVVSSGEDLLGDT